MTKQTVRQLQRENAHKLKQSNFPKPSNFKPISYGCDGEMARRKRQIDKGQLKCENGLMK